MSLNLLPHRELPSDAWGRWALVISFFVHLSIFTSVVLTFPVHYAHPNPSFIFLGSILETQELTPFSQQQEINEKQIMSLNLSDRQQKTRFNPEQITAVPKPSFPEGLTQNDKKYPKIDFLPKPMEDNNLEEEWKIKIPLPKIVPLRLFRK